MSDTSSSGPDVVLIGAGIMSATLGVFLKELEPSLNIEMFETLEGPGLRVRTPGTTPGPAMQPIAS
jgi:malate dehydrogenase (quinone)